MILSDCLLHFDAALAHIHEMLARVPGRQDELGALFLMDAIEFGRTTFEAITLWIDDEKMCHCANTLARPFYESANRIRLASRWPDGWTSLQKFYANEQHCWRVEAAKTEHFPYPADEQEKHEKLMGRRGAGGRRIPSMASLRDVLVENDRLNIKDGLTKEHDDAGKPKNAGQFEYLFVYRMLCVPSHANFISLSFLDHQKLQEQAFFAAGLATLLLIHAVQAYTGLDCKEVEGGALKGFEMFKQRYGLA